MHEKKRKNTYNYIPRDISEETRTVLMTGAPGPPRSSLVAPFVGLVTVGEDTAELDSLMARRVIGSLLRPGGDSNR